MSLAHPAGTIPPLPGRRGVTLFGHDLLDATVDEAVARLLGGRCGTAAFVNAHCVNVAAEDDAYAEALARADILLPDGVGLALAARLHGRRFAANLNGTDLFVPLMRGAGARGLSLYCLGSAPGVAAGAARAAAARAPGLKVAGAAHGYFTSDAQAIADINAARPDILLVGLGVPRQDVWIARHRARLDVGLAMGVGAQFDFWSGRIPRAPLWMRRAGLEWAYRLGLEPRRMFRRYVVGNPAFLARAVRDRLGPASPR